MVTMEKNVHRRSLIATTRPETLLSQRALELLLCKLHTYTQCLKKPRKCLILPPETHSHYGFMIILETSVKIILQLWYQFSLLHINFIHTNDMQYSSRILKTAAGK